MFKHLIAAAVALACAALTAVQASASPVYSVIPCGGAYDPCTVQLTTRTPTDQEKAGLTSDAYKAFWNARGFVQVGPEFGFDLIIRDSSANGFIIGSVVGPFSILTQFVFRDGQFFCCTTDIPFRINDINDNGFAVGENIYEQGVFLADLNTDPIAQRAGKPSVDPAGPQIGHNWLFLAIGDDNSILAACEFAQTGCTPGQRYELRIVSEPASGLALICGGLWLAWVRMRRS